MVVKNEEGGDNDANGIDFINEDWWSAILSKEQQILTVQKDLMPKEDQPTKKGNPKSSLNWNKISEFQRNDKIINVVVNNFNRGGLLVGNRWVNGFVPVSHLIDFPVNCEENQRNIYLADYLAKNINVKIIECDQFRERVVFSERAALAGEGRRISILKNIKVDDIVTGVVTNITGFGVFLDLGGIEGLIHLSELTWGRVSHPREYVKIGDRLEAVVIQVSEEKDRIALSLKQLSQNPWLHIANRYKPDDVIPAVVTSVVPYGAFARLPEGLEGLIHISSLNLPSDDSIMDYFKQGQEVLVSIVHLEPERRRLGLCLNKKVDDYG